MRKGNAQKGARICSTLYFPLGLSSMNTNINRSLKRPPPRRTPHRRPRCELGITLQTLIITAVVVVIAIGVGLLFIALTSSSSEDLEDAGRTGQDAACAPNELLDAVYEQRGLGGPNSPDGVPTKAVGCKPYCATWEFVATPSAGGEYRPGGTGEGSPIGGPEGLGGVFSSKVGCFAPCYWETDAVSHHYTRAKDLIGIDIEENGLNEKDRYFESRLLYYNDNRAPDVWQVRLGVTYRRSETSTEQSYEASDLWPAIRVIRGNPWRSTRDGKAYIQIRYQPGRDDIVQGAGLLKGTPLTPEMINNSPDDRVPTVNTPNWRSNTVRQVNQYHPVDWLGFNTDWEDEHWEIRADPESEVCEIVYTPTDRLICSSANRSCRESNEATGTCPSGTTDSDGEDWSGTPFCRIP